MTWVKHHELNFTPNSDFTHFIHINTLGRIYSWNFITCADVCHLHHNQNTYLLSPYNLCCVISLSINFFPVLTSGNTDLFSIKKFFLFWDCFINGIIFFSTQHTADPFKLCISVFVPACCWVVFHFMDVPQFVYPVTHWRTFGFF